MLDKHQPRAAFVEQLERQIETEARRRNRLADTSPWPLRSRFRMLLAAGALALVSMAVGGAVVGAAYQAQNNERRDQVVAVFARRLNLARESLAQTSEALRAVQQKISQGLANNLDGLDAQSKVSEAQAQVRSLELQLEEVRLTGREPSIDISSPLVSGRDFLSERLRNDMTVPHALLSVEMDQLRAAQTRVEIGLGIPIDVEIARAKVVELQSAVETYARKIDIRQRFVKGEIGAVEADLRVLLGEAEQRRNTLAPKVSIARKQMDSTATLLKVGRARDVDLAEATMRLTKLAADLAKADFELAVIRQRLAR